MELITKNLVLAKEIGVRNNLFGGEILSIIDKATAIYVAEKCNTVDVVTVAIQFDFKSPAKVGNMIHIYGEIVHIGNTSVKCRTEVRKHDVETGKYKMVGEGYMTFVRLDADNEPKPFSDRVKKKIQEELTKKNLPNLNQQ